jgi:hypothetical protein
VAAVTRPARRLPRRAAWLREHQWTAPERAVVIAALAILMGTLFVASYSLALADPVPHRINAGLVGTPTENEQAVAAVEQVANNNLAFHRYLSVAAALRAIDLQHVYAAVDLTGKAPTLYVASAAGASVARVLEQAARIDPTLRVVDSHPLEKDDPNGLDIFYLMLVATIVGFITIFQITANAGKLELRHSVAVVVGLAVSASLVFTLVDGPLLHRLDLPLAEIWGILGLHLLAVASFTSLMVVLLGRWAIVPCWLFFVVLGNSASGGAVSPPLLPRPFALISQWLPSGATVTSLRDAVYFRSYQHVQPLAVIATWTTVLFVAWLVVAHRRQARLDDA